MTPDQTLAAIILSMLILPLLLRAVHNHREARAWRRVAESRRRAWGRE